jgi:hypothetical protein
MSENGKEEKKEKSESSHTGLRDRLALFIALLESAFLPLIILAAILVVIAVIMMLFL